MKILRLFFFLIASCFLLPASVLAIEFKDVDFVTGTLLENKSAQYLHIKGKDDLRVYISGDGKVEFIDKKNNVTLPLFEGVENPLLVYEIEAKKPDHVFYAIFDRSAKYDMQTWHFALLASEGKGKPFRLITNLDDLKENGWSAKGLMLRIKSKELFIDGVIRSKSSPDNEVHPFRVEYDEKKQTVSFENIKAKQDAESIPKRLKPQGEFMLAGFNCGQNISDVTKKLGPDFTIENITEKELERKAKEKEEAEKNKKNSQTPDEEVIDDDETIDDSKIQYFVAHIYNKNLAFIYDKADSSVWRISTNSKDYPTVRGITVGMSLKDVLDKYGHEHKRRRTGYSIEYVYTIKKQNPKSTDMNELVFVTNAKEKVILIYVKKLSEDK